MPQLRPLSPYSPLFKTVPLHGWIKSRGNLRVAGKGAPGIPWGGNVFLGFEEYHGSQSAWCRVSEGGSRRHDQTGTLTDPLRFVPQGLCTCFVCSLHTRFLPAAESPACHRKAISVHCFCPQYLYQFGLVLGCFRLESVSLMTVEVLRDLVPIVPTPSSQGRPLVSCHVSAGGRAYPIFLLAVQRSETSLVHATSSGIKPSPSG